MNLNKVVLFVLIFENLHCSNTFSTKIASLKNIFSYQYLKNIVAAALGTSIIGLIIYKYRQHSQRNQKKVLEVQQKTLEEAKGKQKNQERELQEKILKTIQEKATLEENQKLMMQEALKTIQEKEIQEWRVQREEKKKRKKIAHEALKEFELQEKQRKSIITGAMATMMNLTAIHAYQKKYGNLSLSPLFHAYQIYTPDTELRALRKKQKKLEEKQRIFARETFKSLVEKVSQQLVDPRPFVLSGKTESAKDELLSIHQTNYIKEFYDRHQKTLINLLITNNIMAEKWLNEIKPRIDLYQRYFWGEIYGKESTENVPFAKIQINEKVLQYIAQVLKNIHINPRGVFIKTTSKKKQKEYKIKKLELLGHAVVLAETDVISTSSMLQEYYGSMIQENYKSNIINIYYPTINLNMDKYDWYHKYEFFKHGKNATFLHEAGHVYLLHGIDRHIIGFSNVNIQKLNEIEADCILPVLDKQYTQIMIQNKLKRVLDNYLIYLDKLNKKDNTDKDKLTYIFSEERPSYFEQFIHIADLCHQVWQMNIGHEIDKAIVKVLNSTDLNYIRQITSSANDNIFKIDPQSKNYIGAIDLPIKFKIDRLQLPGKKLYNFMKEEN